MSYQQEYPSEEGRTDVDSRLKEENWFKLISARASEAVTNIQQAGISDSLDTSADVDMESAQSNGDSLDDVKWMETVLTVSIFFFVSLLERHLLLIFFIFILSIALPFHYLIFQIWEGFVFARCNCGIPLSSDILTGITIIFVQLSFFSIAFP